ncbi:hypothetical protein [Melghirimyces algeriensis]|uniref:Uncharacterized membrane protein, BrkB/YihY/UPF0761 family (Not an RNase) n=1 Tax=Melghirimyces algeriensis TaxID=910412 RepID=A0A521ALZ4_9BACL|nr:hypothetical protein [Melghirimyces algeriensis]SMO35854.1 Uncharacterized membrane protein, BrkB/YihY/UPF0761 family (not an RNase) [Melghirimyces algeriensis]
MDTYFGLLKKHGLKMWGGYFLGNLITTVVLSMFILIFYLVGLITIFAAVGISVTDLQTGNIPEGNLEALGAGMVFGIILLLILYCLTILFTSSFQTAGSLGMATEAVLDGSTSLLSFFRLGFRYFWRIFLQSILIILITIPISVPLIAADLGIMFAYEADSMIFMVFCGILWFLFLLALIGFLCLLIFAPVILIAENKGPWESIKLSFQASRKSLGKTVGTILLLILLMVFFFIFYGIIGVIFTLVGASDSGAIGILVNFMMFVLVLLTIPMIGVASTLFIAYRYKRYMRRWVAPDKEKTEEWNHPYGGGNETTVPDEGSHHSHRNDSFRSSEESYSSPSSTDPFSPAERPPSPTSNDSYTPAEKPSSSQGNDPFTPPEEKRYDPFLPPSEGTDFAPSQMDDKTSKSDNDNND